jgi:hypothetical protein
MEAEAQSGGTDNDRLQGINLTKKVEEEDAEVVDIVTAAVTVSCVDMSDVMSLELTPRVEDKTELSSGVTEDVLD